jgi:hypothetical protein
MRELLDFLDLGVPMKYVNQFEMEGVLDTTLSIQTSLFHT